MTKHLYAYVMAIGITGTVVMSAFNWGVPFMQQEVTKAQIRSCQIMAKENNNPFLEEDCIFAVTRKDK